MRSTTYLLEERKDIEYLSTRGRSFLTVKTDYGLMIFHVYRIKRQVWKVSHIAEGLYKNKMPSCTTTTKSDCIEEILHYLSTIGN